MKIKILQKRNVESKPVVILYRTRVANKGDLDKHPNAVNFEKKITEFVNTQTLKYGVLISDVVDENEKFLLVKGVAKQKKRLKDACMVPSSYYKGAEAYWEDDDLYIVIYAINNKWEYPLQSKRKWIEQTRILFNKNKEALCQKYQDCYESNIIENKRSFGLATQKQKKKFFENLTCCETSVNGIKENDMSLFFEEITASDKLHYLHLVEGNRILAINSIDNLFEYFNYSEPKRKNSKDQEKIDYFNQFQLTEKIELTDQLKESLNNIPKISDSRRVGEKIIKFAILEKVPCTESCNCLRMFGYITSSGYMREVSRFYITKEDIIPARIHYNTQWIKAHLSSSISEYHIALGNIDKELCKGTKLEYIASILDNFDISVRGTALYIFLYESIYEMLYKMPENENDSLLQFNQFLLTELNKTIPTSKSQTTILHSAIGNYTFKGNIYKRIGLNKYQFKQISNEIKNNNDIFSFFDNRGLILETVCLFSIFKNIFVKNNEIIFNNTDLCNKDTDKLMETIILLHKRYLEDREYFQSMNISYNINYVSNFTNIFSLVLSIWDITTAMNFIDQLVSLILHSKIIVMNKKSKNPKWNNYYSESVFEELTFLKDYLNIVKNLKNMNQSIALFNPYFQAKIWEKCAKNIKRMHDEITVLFNSIKDEVNREQFNIAVKKCDKWIYDNKNYQWVVKRPENPSEIATEGIQLCHCVKGFIPNVTNGETNILFIRDREKSDKPFFTVEITNNDEIRQVHGFDNKTMFDESSELVDFVKTWCKDKKIKYKSGTSRAAIH